MNRSKEHQRFKSVGKVMLIRVRGALWWTDSYCAGKMLDSGKEPINDVLGWWNLPVGPGYYDVNGRVTRDAKRSEKLPNLGQLIPEKAPRKIRLERQEIHGKPALIARDSDGTLLSLWRLNDDTHIALNDEFTRHLIGRHPKAVLYGTDPNKPVFYVEDGEVVALQMPVRMFWPTP